MANTLAENHSNDVYLAIARTQMTSKHPASSAGQALSGLIIRRLSHQTSATSDGYSR